MRIRQFAWVFVIATAGCRDFDLSSITSALGGELIITVSAGPGVEVGDTLQMSATGRPSGALGLLVYDRLLDARWTVSDPTVATVTPLAPPPNDSTTPAQALLRGLKAGTIRVTVAARGARGETSVRVVPPVAQLSLRLPRDTIFTGDTIEVAVSALDSLGAAISGVPIAVDTRGPVWADLWVQRYTPATIRVVGGGPGLATLIVQFRRVTAQVQLAVVSR
ncbi:MAG: Ig-like domain-containing protein [Gemmatimonadaceae bacterium]|nr:Ig-like domain-containing protein [Gemmatimonadaceae bacterium]